MRYFFFLSALLLFCSCANEDKYKDQPTGPWTYPISEYRAIQIVAGRTEGGDIARLVGWDEGFYYFDWSQKGATIRRGSGRVDRKQFDLENGGALTLQRGNITLAGTQVRTVVFE